MGSEGTFVSCLMEAGGAQSVRLTGRCYSFVKKCQFENPFHTAQVASFMSALMQNRQIGYWSKSYQFGLSVHSMCDFVTPTLKVTNSCNLKK